MEKVKLIQGNFKRAEEIGKTLEELGGTDKNSLTFRYEDSYYYVDQFGVCGCITEKNAKKYVAEGKAEIYELPPLKQKCELKPFDRVLVKSFEDSRWVIDLFGFKKDDYYMCVGGAWMYCIKYEGNEALLGTTDNPNDYEHNSNDRGILGKQPILDSKILWRNQD